MSDDIENNEIPSELDTLKQRADMMGITYHPNIGVDKLRKKIDAKLSPEKTVEKLEEAPSAQKTKPPKFDKKKHKMLTHAEYVAETSARARKDTNRLIRIRVTCMNPNKSQWEGEIISVGSAKMGTFKKYVPFNNEDGWHVPKIIYEAMKERKFTSFYTVRGPRGEKIRKGKLVPEFNIEVLPPLTPAEIKDLAQRQAMREGKDI